MRNVTALALLLMTAPAWAGPMVFTPPGAELPKGSHTFTITVSGDWQRGGTLYQKITKEATGGSPTRSLGGYTEDLTPTASWAQMVDMSVKQYRSKGVNATRIVLDGHPGVLIKKPKSFSIWTGMGKTSAELTYQDGREGDEAGNEIDQTIQEVISTFRFQ
ncbi:MAG: hypothetical protein J0I12_21730 [Candidatus Eremiobacteraeota bacterium]|nr:hypothetical protein [Candidatus Eremiobacteraeota bacterium]